MIPSGQRLWWLRSRHRSRLLWWIRSRHRPFAELKIFVQTVLINQTVGNLLQSNDPTNPNQRTATSFLNLDFRLFEFWTVILFKSLVNCDCCSLLTRNGHGTVINRIIYLLLSGFIVSVSTYLTTERCILNGDDDGRHGLLLPESSLVSTVIKSGVLVFIKDLTTLLSLFYLAHE